MLPMFARSQSSKNSNRAVSHEIHDFGPKRIAYGTTPEIPDIYEGRMYIVKNFFYNSCTVDVVEKDMDREYATYRVNKCQDVLAIAPGVGNVVVSKNVF